MGGAVAEAPLCPACAQAKGQQALVGKLGKNVGTAIGLELRDSTQALNATNTKPVVAGMAFNVAVGERAARSLPSGRSQLLPGGFGAPLLCAHALIPLLPDAPLLVPAWLSVVQECRGWSGRMPRMRLAKCTPCS